ncbi:MAG: tRNA pseudouridine(38-40) synthase TruA [Leptospiraceae bacterium]|nr:tRNA pseudouridine(38-40) synthase TruA [Leptospiraceae bacterium]
MNVVATVAYDGGAFAGFQIQKDVVTVQSCLEEALKVLYRKRCVVHCAGRTDAGVHATGQVVSFEVPEIRPRIIPSLNALTPDSMAVMHLEEAPSDFHPRFSCIAREYQYLISNARAWNPFLKGRVWHRTSCPPPEEFLEMLPVLEGEQDFGAFTRPQYLEDGTRRYLDTVLMESIQDSMSGERLLSFRVRGNAFLHNMIRIMMGTLVTLAEECPGPKRPATLKEILASRDRKRAGRTAPPQGLYFRHAYYPDTPDLRRLGLKTLNDYPRFGQKSAGNSDGPHIRAH